MGKISKHSTEELMNEILAESQHKISLYEAEQCLFKRWRQGIDLKFLLDLLQSEKSKERARGAYYLCELGGTAEGVTVAAIQLASDPLADCRSSFVGYVASSGYYDEAIASGLAKCLLDLDLYVRAMTIRWAIRTSDERFEDFSRLVESGAGAPELTFRNLLANDFWKDATQRRAIRGLDIIRRIRSGEQIPQIRRDFPEEDSFVLDFILFGMTRHERSASRQRVKAGCK